jgi:hypothetical protein
VTINLDLVAGMEWTGQHTVVRFSGADHNMLFDETPEDIIQRATPHRRP